MVETTPGRLLERLRAYRPDAVEPKWIDRDETYGRRVYTRAR